MYTRPKSHVQAELHVYQSVDDQSPMIYSPKELRSIDPKFAPCKFWHHGVVDPLTALQRQPELMDTNIITPVGEPASETASPDQLVQPNQASRTTMYTASLDLANRASPSAPSQPVEPNEKSQLGASPSYTRSSSLAGPPQASDSSASRDDIQ